MHRIPLPKDEIVWDIYNMWGLEKGHFTSIGKSALFYSYGDIGGHRH